MGRWLARLRGPVGGGAPNRDEPGAEGVWDDEPTDCCRRARGARGGAWPDIAEHDANGVWGTGGRAASGMVVVVVEETKLSLATVGAA